MTIASAGTDAIDVRTMTLARQHTDLDLDVRTHDILQRFGFDGLTFGKLRARLAAGEAGPETNQIPGEVAPPEQDDVRSLPDLGTAERERLDQLGRAALAEGKVGIVRSALGPEGHIFVGGALWRARAPQGSGKVRTGTKVRVLGLNDSLTLDVEIVDDTSTTKV